VAAYFRLMETAASMLQGMAESQRAGQPFSADQMAFINQTIDEVRMSIGSGGPIPVPVGWYPKLFFNDADVRTSDPTIADVHSSPDPDNPRILHVATGTPRLMVVTADTCNGPRAYAGVVSSYFEHIPADYTRLTDQEWAAKLTQSPPADVPWISDLVAR
jgi:hypothetical protein